MKTVKNIIKGQLVQVPTYCFAPNRSGWNGWLFTKGIVLGFGTDNKTGKRLVKVEFPTRNYGRKHLTRTGQLKEDDREREKIVKWFIPSVIFEADLQHQEYITQFPREHWKDECYDHETEYLIDKGIVEDYKAQDAERN